MTRLPSLIDAVFPTAQSKSLRRASLLLTLTLAMSALPQLARAGDLDSAKQQLEKVKLDVENASWSSIDDDVKATESFLDGLPAADSAPVKQQLEDLKTKAAAGIKDYKSKGILDTSKRELDEAASSLASDPAGAKDMIDKTDERLNSDDAKKYVDADTVAKLKSRATSLRAMVITKYYESALPIVKQYDDAMAAQPFKDAKSDEDVQHVVQDLGQLKSRINGALTSVPATDPRVVALNEKLAGYDKVIATAAGGAAATQAADQLAKNWKSEQEYFAGWDQEKEGPSWDQYQQITSEEMGNLLMPKTIELLSRVKPWFDESSVKTTVEQYKDNATVKTTMDEAHKAFDTAAAKVDAALNKLLTQAEAIPTPTQDTIRNKAGYLADRADMWLKGTSYHDADVARAKKLGDKWNGAVAGDAAALQANLEKMTAEAKTAWPAIASGIKSEDGFTPDKMDQFRGKVVHITGNNRLGWDYEPGSYRYAKAINGMPIAAKYDSNVAAAVNTAVKQTGQELPDEGWDFYATVDGPGKIQARTQTSGDVKVDGQNVGTVTSEGHQNQDCVVLTIFALHAGPVAVGSSTPGAAKSEMGTGTGAAASSIMGTLMHLIELAICLAAAGMVVMKTRPALTAQMTGGSTAVKLPAADTVALAGGGFILLGLLWLISKLILGDLLPAAFLTLSGVVLSSDMLQSKAILPAELATSLRSFAVPVAAGTAVFGIVHLFWAHLYLF